MPRTAFYDEAVRIPSWVVDRLSFRRWLNSDDFPENGRICFLAGELWVDMTMEQLFSHNQVKQEFNLVLGGLAKMGRLGRYFPDGAYMGNAEADFTAEPDGTFVSHDALKTGRVRLVETAKVGFLEMEGSPEMVLEVVSDSSVAKDTVRLRQLYWEADIAEYWIVDARGDRLSFEILRHMAKGYSSLRRQSGWLKSALFGKSFQLTRVYDALGNPEYTFAVR